MQISKLVWRGRQYSCLVCADKSASLCRVRRIVCRAVWLSGVADSLPAFSATHHFFTHSRPATHLVLDYFAQKILVQEYLCLLSDCMSMCGDVWFEFNRSQHGLCEKTYLVLSGLDTVWASTFWGFGSSIKSNHKPWITKKQLNIMKLPWETTGWFLDALTPWTPSKFLVASFMPFSWPVLVPRTPSSNCQWQ